MTYLIWCWKWLVTSIIFVTDIFSNLIVEETKNISKSIFTKRMKKISLIKITGKLGKIYISLLFTLTKSLSLKTEFSKFMFFRKQIHIPTNPDGFWFLWRSGWTFWRVWKFFLTKGDELFDVFKPKFLSCLFQLNKLETNTERRDKNSFF